MKEFKARCGIECEQCDYREKFKCPGCRKAEGKIFWGECELAKCSMAKGIDFCYECGEFPCDLLKAFAYNEEQGDNGKRIENLRKWKNETE